MFLSGRCLDWVGAGFVYSCSTRMIWTPSPAPVWFSSCFNGLRVTLVSLVQLLFWEEGSLQSDAGRVRVPSNNTALLSGLKASTVYQISVRAQNSAGLGPCSPAINITTRKPRKCTRSTLWYEFLFQAVLF